MSLRICHAIPFFHPATQFGGPVTQTHAVCRLLAERGHQVRVVTTELGIDPGIPRERWLSREGYTIWYARVGPLGRFAPHFAPRVAGPLAEALEDTDVLHLGLAFTHLNAVGRRMAARSGVPYIYSPRSCLDPVRLDQKRIRKRVFLRLFEHDVIGNATIVHALTVAEREQVCSHGVRPERVEVIPNLTVLGNAPWPEPQLFRQRFGFDANALLVLFMGRLHSIKGLDLLVHCFASALRAAPSARLVIAGRDEGGGVIARRAAASLGVSHAVELIGHLDGDIRLAALRAADVIALTSYSEGMPNTVLEACAAGTAVLITDRCQLPEVAEWGAGCVEAADAEPLAGALCSMLVDHERRAAMGARGVRMVEACFSPDSVIPRLEALYERAAGEHTYSS